MDRARRTSPGRRTGPLVGHVKRPRSPAAVPARPPSSPRRTPHRSPLRLAIVGSGRHVTRRVSATTSVQQSCCSPVAAALAAGPSRPRPVDRHRLQHRRNADVHGVLIPPRRTSRRRCPWRSDHHEHHHPVRPARVLLPTFTLLLATGGAMLGVIAIATDDVGGAQTVQHAARRDTGPVDHAGCRRRSRPLPRAAGARRPLPLVGGSRAGGRCLRAASSSSTRSGRPRPPCRRRRAPPTSQAPRTTTTSPTGRRTADVTRSRHIRTHETRHTPAALISTTSPTGWFSVVADRRPAPDGTSLVSVVSRPAVPAGGAALCSAKRRPATRLQHGVCTVSTLTPTSPPRKVTPPGPAVPASRRRETTMHIPALAHPGRLMPTLGSKGPSRAQHCRLRCNPGRVIVRA